jgi:CelD/BcsL family acetyltransferase involved in cellulose biosynthesis
MAEAGVAIAGDVLERAEVDRPEAVSVSMPAPVQGLALVTDLRSFLDLEPDWRTLEQDSAARHTVFQSFDWLRCWAAAHAGRRGAGSPVIALGRRDGRLVFAWPLMKTRSGPVTLLRWMTEPYGQYGDVLLAKGECADRWMSDALVELGKLKGIDSIRLRHVRADAAALPFLQIKARDARFVEYAPSLDLSQFSGQAAYEGRYTATQRKRRKKIRKAIEDDLGAVAFTVLTDRAAITRAIDASIAEKSKWIEARGRQNRVLGSSRMSSFLRSLPMLDTGGCRLVISELSAGGRPLSWEIGLRMGGTHYAFITSHVSRYTDYSPARLHMDLSQRRALADGMDAFDLMIPADAYKDSWSSRRTEARDYHIALTRKGSLYGRLYLERIRPLLRFAYYHMPQGLLKLLKPIVRH